MKPVVGFVIEYQEDCPTGGPWVPWMGYIDGEDVWLVDFDEDAAGIDMFEVKKIPPKRYIVLSGQVKLSKREPTEPTFKKDIIDNPDCYPDLTVEEIKELKKDYRQLFKSLVGKTYEFQPFSEQI